MKGKRISAAVIVVVALTVSGLAVLGGAIYAQDAGQREDSRQQEGDPSHDDLLVARSRDGLGQAVAGATSTPFTVSVVL